MNVTGSDEFKIPPLVSKAHLPSAFSLPHPLATGRIERQRLWMQMAKRHGRNCNFQNVSGREPTRTMRDDEILVPEAPIAGLRSGLGSSFRGRSCLPERACAERD